MSNPFFKSAAPATGATALAEAPAAEAPAPAEAAPAPAATPAAAQGGAAQFAGPTGEQNTNALFAAGTGGTGGQAKLKDDAGCFVVIRATEYIAELPTSIGTTDAIRADWVPVDGPDAGEVRADCLIFGKVVVSSIKSNLDRGIPFTIGTVGHGAAKPGKNAPLVLNAPADGQAETAIEVARYLGWIN